ncbi:hypothetical protein A9Q99_07995 [Gammaproteobacteria bacterium 45_16_T64]|nr:hypothetical protein A9Q99_07995 [Gammaproteobacteria bacterium 45_16_T64]
MYKIKQRFGSTALITGASSGIGKAYAEALAAEGVNLILVARRESVLNDIADDLKARHRVNIQVIAQDLIAHDAAEIVYEKATSDVDILINNAGYGSYGRFEDIDIQSETDMVDLNCRQVISLTHRFLPNMKQNKRGAIICLSSVVGTMPTPYMSTYSATKAFNRYFAESLSGELRTQGISVQAVCPGDTHSDFRSSASFDKKMPISQRTPEDVVRSSLRTLGRRSTVTDGIINKIATKQPRFIPTRLLIAINEKIWRPKGA